MKKQEKIKKVTKQLSRALSAFAKASRRSLTTRTKKKLRKHNVRAFVLSLKLASLCPGGVVE